MLTYLFLVTGATKYEGAEKAAGTLRCIREVAELWPRWSCGEDR